MVRFAVLSVPLGGVGAAKLSQPTEMPMQQSPKAMTVRGWKKAEWEEDFFFMGGFDLEGRLN
jgi:hypothetical protein